MASSNHLADVGTVGGDVEDVEGMGGGSTEDDGGAGAEVTRRVLRVVCGVGVASPPSDGFCRFCGPEPELEVASLACSALLFLDVAPAPVDSNGRWRLMISCAVIRRVDGPGTSAT